MLSNGNSFGCGEGSERYLLSTRWMFPGGVQPLDSAR